MADEGRGVWRGGDAGKVCSFRLPGFHCCPVELLLLSLLLDGSWYEVTDIQWMTFDLSFVGIFCVISWAFPVGHQCYHVKHVDPSEIVLIWLKRVTILWSYMNEWQNEWWRFNLNRLLIKAWWCCNSAAETVPIFWQERKPCKWNSKINELLRCYFSLLKQQQNLYPTITQKVQTQAFMW